MDVVCQPGIERVRHFLASTTKHGQVTEIILPVPGTRKGLLKLYVCVYPRIKPGPWYTLTDWNSVEVTTLNVAFVDVFTNTVIPSYSNQLKFIVKITQDEYLKHSVIGFDHV